LIWKRRYSDSDNLKEKKKVNKIVDYTLGKKRLKGEKIKIVKSKVKKKLITPNPSTEKVEEIEEDYSEFLCY
jgi:hypothetical protein